MFVDESGFQLQPLVRKTWALRGQTPVLANWDRHDRITAVSALAWTPATNHMQLYFELLPHNARAFDFLWFLRSLYRELERELIVVWDRLSAHRKAARVLQALEARWVQFEWLPPYCPELDPVEPVWGSAKWGHLCNWPAPDCSALEEGLLAELTRQAHDPQLLESHFRHAELSLDCLRRG